MQIGEAASYGNPGDSIAVKLPNGKMVQAIAGNVINSSKVLIVNGYVFSETSPRIELSRTEVFQSRQPAFIVQKLAVLVLPEFWGLAIASKGNSVFSFGLSLGHYQSYFDMGLDDFAYELGVDRQDIQAGIIRLSNGGYKGWIVLPGGQSFYQFSGTATRIYPDLELFPNPSALLPTAEHSLTTTLVDNSEPGVIWKYSYYGENFLLSNIAGEKRYYENYPLSLQEELISGAVFNYDPVANFDQNYIDPYNLNSVIHYSQVDEDFNYLRINSNSHIKTGYTDQIDTFNEGNLFKRKLYIGGKFLPGGTYAFDSSTGEEDVNYNSTAAANCLLSSLNTTTIVTGGISRTVNNSESLNYTWENDHYLYFNGNKIEGEDSFAQTRNYVSNSFFAQDVTRTLECVETFSSPSQSRGGWRETSINAQGSTNTREVDEQMNFERKKTIMFPLTLTYSRRETEVRIGNYELNERSVDPSWTADSYGTSGGLDGQANISEYEYLKVFRYVVSKEKRTINDLVLSSPNIAIWRESYEACEFETNSTTTRTLVDSNNNVVISYIDRIDEFLLGNIPVDETTVETYDAQYQESYDFKWFVVNNGNVQAMDLKSFCHRFYIEGDGISNEYDLYRNEQFPFEVTYSPFPTFGGSTKYLQRVTSDRSALDLPEFDVPRPRPLNVTPNTTYEFADGQWAWLKTANFNDMEVYIDTKDIKDGTYRRYKGVISNFNISIFLAGEGEEIALLDSVTITVRSVEVMEYLFFVDYFVNTFFLGSILVTNDIERLVAVAYTPDNCNSIFTQGHFGFGAVGGSPFRDYSLNADLARRRNARFDDNMLILSEPTPNLTPYSPELYKGYIQKLRLEGNKFVYDSIEKLFSYNPGADFVSTSGYRSTEADLIRDRLAEEVEVQLIPYELPGLNILDLGKLTPG